VKNVYDILKDDRLVYILSEKYSKKEKSGLILKSAAVVVNLYYPDILEFYLEYLNQIPEEIDVYIISSNSQIEGKINNYIKNKDNVHYVKKTNRGRDVSALLITARDIVMNYNYICFIHDKKPNFEYLAEDIRFWNQNLWDNTIKSKQYIENVLEIFEEHKEIGLLVPPKPIGVYIPDWHTNAWRDDFKIVQQLCREFDLKCDLDPQKPVVTLGTVFWGKTKILYKILSKKWKYEDFPDEPMPLDGTVSHGLERILAYAAQDAGFETGIVMCDSYARTLYIKIQDMMMETYRNLSENFYIEQLDQLMSYKKQKEFIVKAFGRNKSVYLYGAGKYGCRFLKMIHMWGYSPKGFVVSDGHRKTGFVEGYPVWELGELNDFNAVIAITANYEKHYEIKNNLKKYGFKNYFAAC
jgi:lipopolysaccharide biosynthesis protein